MMTKNANVRMFKKSLGLAFLAGLMAFYFVFSGDIAIAQTDDHTAAAETSGKKVWDSLQTKEKTCADLTEEDYEFLGEYYMGQMTGDSHAAMNQMMVSMMGEEGEEQMHTVMGKRLSGCDTTAAYPANGVGFMPMMGMMNMMGGGMMSGRYSYDGGSWSNFMNFSDSNNMMSFGPSFLFVGWIFAILWHVLIIVGIVVLIKWLFGKMGGGVSSSALSILKERYAKEEISKQEFEEKKRELM